jgi:hypothetical protein
MDAWASDVSNIADQQAALRKHEGDEEKERTAVQRLVVAVAGLARGHSRGVLEKQ